MTGARASHLKRTREVLEDGLLEAEANERLDALQKNGEDQGRQFDLISGPHPFE